MLKHNFLIISILFFIACNSDKTTILSGKIVKPTNNKIQLLKDEVLVNEILIDKDGTFKSLIDIDKNGLFNFFHPPEFQYLIINKGDSLVLRLNSLDFDESLIFSGKGSAKNNYLIDDVIEKPSVKTAPSNKAVIGRYILPKSIFLKLKNQKSGKGGEIHITDAIQSLIKDKNEFIAHNFSGKYLDCGSMHGYIKSTLEISKL